MSLAKYFPFLTWFRLITKDTLKADLIAGFTGAVIVLPQGVAFAAIAGLPPEYGLYTAMITPIIAALFGSSRHLISGPTTAISIVLFATVSNYAEPGTAEYISLVLTVTFLAGIYQMAFGLARLGSLVNFVSHTVIIGFTAGAAILIVTSQVKHVLGIAVPRGESFLHTWGDIFTQLGSLNEHVFFIATVTLVVAVMIKRTLPQWPNLLIGLIAGSVLALMFNAEETGINLVGQIPAQLPPLSMPDFSLTTIKQLAPEAFAVALLGLIEAVSISRSVAAMSNQRINSNQEFIGQGLSNVVGSFFSSYAGSGSFTRSGINYTAGAKTPMSAIFAALLLMLIVLLIAPLTAYLPVAAMGGVILIVAYNLIDFKHIKMILKNSKSESSILLVTFFATLFLELEFAIYMGVLLSLVLFLAKTSTPNIPTLGMDIDKVKNKRALINVQKKPVKQCPQLKIIRIDMSVYFGSLNHIQTKINQISENERIYNILIIGDRINFIDLSGSEMLVQEHRRLKKLGGGLYFCDLSAAVYEFAARTCFISHVGNHHFFDSKKEAISAIYHSLDKDICKTCPQLAFKECN